MLEESREQKIGLLGLDQFEVCWPAILQSLEAIPHFWEFYTQEFFFEAVARGSMQVWAIGGDHGVDVIITTEVVQYPKMKVFRLMGASGEGLDFYSERLQNVFDGFAKMQGCERIELIGRPGWIRKFRHLRGSSFDYVVMSTPVGSLRSH